MKKLILCLLSFFIFGLPSLAGQLEDAIKSSKPVVLYIYTPECGYCKKFDPIYRKLISDYGQKYEFVKLNGNTEYGRRIAYQYRAPYVPYVVLIKARNSSSTVVPGGCLLEYRCVSQKINTFLR